MAVIEYEPAPRVARWFRLLLLIVSGLLLWWVLAFVYPTVNQYEQVGGELIRINRYSGDAFTLTDSGWILMSTALPPTITREEP